jgi:hypothetical protein
MERLIDYSGLRGGRSLRGKNQVAGDNDPDRREKALSEAVVDKELVTPYLVHTFKFISRNSDYFQKTSLPSYR